MSSSVEKRKRRESASCGTTISYQYPSGGVEEILRPTLVVSGGRSYRKLTDVEFGRRGREEVERPRDWSLQMVIEGPAKSNVADAKRRVEIIVWTNREKEKPTHFISIPLTVPHIRDRVSLFKSSVLDSCRRNIHDARFELTDVEFGRRAGSRERRGREAERLEPSDGFVEEEEKETV
ncbi:hypothetical protein GBAR_LOCUS8551 [Geodia barretti]|uniref:Uncharacterized protein n=1 Tax=Geodia barretti TaxID=519541 RepID=A0AA35RLU6_GEOBA|nr:hypothetical protein GBAR_LOCUS8551 [Geodia barretti]